MGKIRKPENLTPIENLLYKEMEKGVAAARDPFNAYANDTTLRKTFPGSDWYIGVCSVCGDTFREGDWVYQCPDCKEFFHEDERYALACWSKHRKNCKST